MRMPGTTLPPVWPEAGPSAVSCRSDDSEGGLPVSWTSAQLRLVRLCVPGRDVELSACISEDGEAAVCISLERLLGRKAIGQ
jgi:hypothetical protein